MASPKRFGVLVFTFLNPLTFPAETTLVIVISKTFTTTETMLNARTVRCEQGPHREEEAEPGSGWWSWAQAETVSPRLTSAPARANPHPSFPAGRG